MDIDSLQPKISQKIQTIVEKNIKVITNAGGVNPEMCRQKLLEVSAKLNIDIKIAIIKGDDKSLSIAAASIIAKVHRDRLMKKLSLKFKDFGWEKNAGYGTKKHINEIISIIPEKFFNKCLTNKSISTYD